MHHIRPLNIASQEAEQARRNRATHQSLAVTNAEVSLKLDFSPGVHLQRLVPPMGVGRQHSHLTASLRQAVAQFIKSDDRSAIIECRIKHGRNMQHSHFTTFNGGALKESISRGTTLTKWNTNDPR